MSFETEKALAPHLASLASCLGRHHSTKKARRQASKDTEAGEWDHQNEIVAVEVWQKGAGDDGWALLKMLLVQPNMLINGKQISDEEGERLGLEAFERGERNTILEHCSASLDQGKLVLMSHPAADTFATSWQPAPEQFCAIPCHFESLDSDLVITLYSSNSLHIVTEPEGPFVKLAMAVTSFPFTDFNGSLPTNIVSKNEDVASTSRVGPMVEPLLAATFSALSCDRIEWWAGVNSGSGKMLLQLACDPNDIADESASKKILRRVQDEPVQFDKEDVKSMGFTVDTIIAVPVRWANARSGECVLLFWGQEKEEVKEVNEDFYSYFASTLDDFFVSVRHHHFIKTEESSAHYSPPQQGSERKGKSPVLGPRKALKTRQRSRSSPRMSGMGESSFTDHNNPEAQAIKQDIRESRVLSDMEPRRGKWSDEEEKYASFLVDCFRLGTLPLHEGATLRTTLAEQLHCTPMRITKKYNKDASIGKQVYKRDFSTAAADWRARRDDALRKLRRLRYIFVESIKKRNQIDLDKIVDNAIGSYKYCTHVPHGESRPAVDDKFEQTMKNEAVIPSPSGTTPSWEASAPVGAPAQLDLPAPQYSSSAQKNRSLSSTSGPEHQTSSHSVGRRSASGGSAKRERTARSTSSAYRASVPDLTPNYSLSGGHQSSPIESSAVFGWDKPKDSGPENYPLRTSLSSTIGPLEGMSETSGYEIPNLPISGDVSLGSETPGSAESTSQMPELPLSHGGTANYSFKPASKERRYQSRKRDREAGLYPMTSKMSRHRSGSLDTQLTSAQGGMPLSSGSLLPPEQEEGNKRASVPQPAERGIRQSSGQHGSGFLRPEYRPMLQSQQDSQTKSATSSESSVTGAASSNTLTVRVPRSSSTEEYNLGNIGPSPAITSGLREGETPGFTPRTMDLNSSSQLVLKNISSQQNPGSEAKWWQTDANDEEYEGLGESSPNSPLGFLAGTSADKPPRRRALSADDTDMLRGTSPFSWRDSNGEESDTGGK
eukprot:gb/GECG01008357.1/.p1 GENE.gb/GECG01008357.1/~~gb/GECG01008357.1/.p1  ORF type:complete len:1002 (+),score=135.51 gb/GECG01008357.1/:1-3006(+)